MQDNVETDLYGGKKAKNDFENFDEDVFGGEDPYNDPGYQRLDNGMGVNENVEEMRK